ncbi:MAG: glycosyltransferase, partial [Pseudonocardiaceae bacterium]
MTTLFVATTGGHLTQLDSLASRIPPSGSPQGNAPGEDSVWVTHANEQSRSMLADRDVEFVPYVGVRSVPDVLRCIPYARRLMARRKVTRAVSTGSGIALGYLPYLAARGVECHYIESATRVSGPSLTGRVLQWVPG